ncbi:Alpha/Beta hydrolase protein [Apodospora peruviana]|uniref:Alpha/Beta hydrolase protein n=1 Tax=Apodospora peruviana TaxID=516989 RepID=A0AAE0IJE5_9PEZI|nr:Alpha/Beta hydrolase protein [Apodospora peruviana]
MFDTNPNLIQDANDQLWARPTPLVLIHDGGGTIFSYYCLGDLGRPVFGIFNPHYGTDQVWEGGLPEMARHYVGLIKETIPQGDILIGGWSLGGLISLEVARLLAEDDALNVLGIVMIDSIYPKHVDGSVAARIVQHAIAWNDNTKQETRDAVNRCFTEAGTMVRQWTLPTWGDEDVSEKNEPVEAAAKDLRPPPVILLRAQEVVPVGEEGVSKVDISRSDRLLGWGHYRKDLIVQVVDIPGHHFSIFQTEWRLDIITEKLQKACRDLERIAAGPAN